MSVLVEVVQWQVKKDCNDMREETADIEEAKTSVTERVELRTGSPIEGLNC